MIYKRREDEHLEHLPAEVDEADGNGLADHRSLHLVEEELIARTEATHGGGVLIRKQIVEEKRTIEVPVKREEVIIENLADNPHRPANATVREVSPDEPLRIPVLEEEVRVEKFPVVVEELVVGKRTREETELITGAVRREVPVLDFRGQLDTQGDIDAYRRPPAAATTAPPPYRDMAAVEHHTSEPSTARMLLGLSTGPLTLTGLLLSGWLYRRWRHERNRPIHRLRSAFADRTSSVPAGLLLGGTLAGWLLRGLRTEDDDRRMDQAESRWHTLAAAGASRWADRPSRGEVTAGLADLAEDARERSGDWLPQAAAVAGVLGLGSLLYLIGRAMRGRGTRPRYIGTPGVESALGRDRTLSGELPREMAY